MKRNTANKLIQLLREDTFRSILANIKHALISDSLDLLAKEMHSELLHLAKMEKEIKDSITKEDD